MRLSDRDRSASLSEKEIRMLLDVRLAVLEGVTIKTDILEEKLKQDSSLAGIMAVLQASLKDNVEQDEKVFVFEF